jgi:2-polyprenyl-6-methoxyphenol hydroxylase-like FAD-dependent oxidoreductase
VAAARTVIVAGAGIGGLTAALAVAQRGFAVTLFEAAPRLEEIGAGLQLSPNAARVLIALGIEERLRPHVVSPEDLAVRSARSGRLLAQAPLGASVAQRYGAPYWVIHRGDLQAALCEAVAATPAITLELGTRVEGFAARDGGVAVSASQGLQSFEAHGLALVAADGLWSTLRQRLGHRAAPRAAGHTAWRTLVPTEAAPKKIGGSFTFPAVNLWLGHDAHLVHYPVKAGRMINVVAIVDDEWREPGWNTPGATRELLDRFAAEHWHASARDLLAASEHWQKWALFDCAPLSAWGHGPVTLLGDAAHPMLPYLAQGAAMAIEDAAVLAACLSRNTDAAVALRRYEASRLPRTTRVQRDARHNGTVYHMRGAAAVLRSLGLMAMGGDRLIGRYDWLYGWTPP